VLEEPEVPPEEPVVPDELLLVAPELSVDNKLLIPPVEAIAF